MQKRQFNLRSLLWGVFIAAIIVAMMGFIARSGDFNIPLFIAPVILAAAMTSLFLLFAFTYLLVLPFAKIHETRQNQLPKESLESPQPVTNPEIESAAHLGPVGDSLSLENDQKSQREDGQPPDQVDEK